MHAGFELLEDLGASVTLLTLQQNDEAFAAFGANKRTRHSRREQAAIANEYHSSGHSTAQVESVRCHAMRALHGPCRPHNSTSATNQPPAEVQLQ
jgi:hypothetical protein